MITADILHHAATQHGVISREQLISTFGVSPSTFTRTRSKGLIVDVVPGVVRFASSPETFAMRCRAVQLRLGPNVFLSGWTAGALAGLRSMRRQIVHVTVPTRVDRSMPGWVDVHRSSWYSDADRMVRDDGLLVATPMRMLWGLATVCNQYRFDRAAEDAWHLGLITPADALEYLDAHRCRGKDGVARIEGWLDRALDRDRPTQSNLERVLLEAIERCGLPTPVRQYPLAIGTGEVIHLDIAWPDIRLAVEPGASWYHGGDLQQRHDQDRDRACAESGWMTVRFDESMRADPDAAATQVARIHRRRQAELRKVRR